MIQSIDLFNQMIDTKEKILDTAERLFGERGYAATSLRQVIATAKVNIAAVHYHFGSKEDLLDAVVVRKAGPVTAARLALLDKVEASAKGKLKVEDVLQAFLLPTADMAQRSPQFVTLVGRLFAEGIMPRIFEKHFKSSMLRFLAALGRALPHLSQEELLWRVHFMIGAMAHTMCGSPVMHMIGTPTDFETRMTRLVGFLTGGFRAPGESGGK